MQRLGDLAAGTMVIVDERSWRLPMAKVDDPRAAALASFLPPDYRVSRSMARTLAVYAERRHYLTPARRREIARHLTVPLIGRFEFRDDIDPDLLMVALYYKTYLADPSTEPPELGALAGFSPLLKDQGKPHGLTDGEHPVTLKAADSQAGAGGEEHGASTNDRTPGTGATPPADARANADGVRGAEPSPESEGNARPAAASQSGESP
jgi:hypothetical protein